MELDIGVGVTVLDSDDKAADSRHTGKVPFGFLVGVLRVLLVAGDELMVEVEVDAVARIELLGSLEKPEHQRVEFVCSVEVVCDVIVVHVGGIVATEASECPLDGVGTRNPDVVVAIPEVLDVHHVFDAVTATEVVGEERGEDVTIAKGFGVETASAEERIDGFADAGTIELVEN